MSALFDEPEAEAAEETAEGVAPASGRCWRRIEDLSDVSRRIMADDDELEACIDYLQGQPGAEAAGMLADLWSMLQERREQIGHPHYQAERRPVVFTFPNFAEQTAALALEELGDALRSLRDFAALGKFDGAARLQRLRDGLAALLEETAPCAKPQA